MTAHYVHFYPLYRPVSTAVLAGCNGIPATDITEPERFPSIFDDIAVGVGGLCVVSDALGRQKSIPLLHST